VSSSSILSIAALIADPDPPIASPVPVVAQCQEASTPPPAPATMAIAGTPPTPPSAASSTAAPSAVSDFSSSDIEAEVERADEQVAETVAAGTEARLAPRRRLTSRWGVRKASGEDEEDEYEEAFLDDGADSSIVPNDISASDPDDVEFIPPEVRAGASAGLPPPSRMAGSSTGRTRKRECTYFAQVASEEPPLAAQAVPWEERWGEGRVRCDPDYSRSTSPFMLVPQ